MPNVIRFECRNCGVEIKCGADYAGRAARCPKCRGSIQVPANTSANPIIPTVQPYDLKGDRLGMSLSEFKRKHYREVDGHNETIPWCSDTRPGMDMDELLSKAWHSDAGIITCRLDFPFERRNGRAGLTVAGVETQLLIYEFVDQQLFEIDVAILNERFGEVCDALRAKYGSPAKEENDKLLIWTNGASTIVAKKGGQRVGSSTLVFSHNKLSGLAESRKPGPAVHDL